MSIDLHTHSTCSDGTDSPEELVARAAKKGLSALALTDHDTVTGVARAVAAGVAEGVEVVTGVELSTRWKKKDLHLLGYLFEPTDSAFLDGLAWLQGGRHQRNLEIANNLQKLGFAITFDEVREEAGPGVIGRPHFARVMIKKRIVASTEEAFSVYLGAGKPGWAPRRAFDTAEAIALIHRAGGVAVVAHPYTLRWEPLELRREVGVLSDAGLDGLEVIYPAHSSRFRNQLLGLVGEFHLVATGGSDWHGDNRPGRTLAGGVNAVPDEVLERLRHRQRRYVVIAAAPSPGTCATE